MSGIWWAGRQLLREAAHYVGACQKSRYQQLRTLRELDEHQLADIGVTRREALTGRPDTTERRPDRAGTIGMTTTESAGTTASPILVRDAREADMPAIQAIYTHHVLHGLASFEETPPSVEEMLVRRQAVLGLGLPYLAAEQGGRIVGYSYATSYRPRPAYRHTIEDSIYVADGLGGRKIGSTLLGALISRCEAGPWRQMLANIGDSGNAGSIGLHRSFGFEPIGTLRSTGFKFGRWVDTVLMQRSLGPGDQTLPGEAR
ncbi:MAG: GNAT family N-acetyltransferase [Bosea sp.]|nr:GNAT family N-acetyltransferase [Bosea sp. (in: a-proteobacteria)]MCP4737471.1 GNAT family N-acetyltransferase [Bosea sp. (in: a-proteobacteria)]